MAIALKLVLEHPSLAPARPRLLAGSDQLHRLVRWVHSSEVLDIAPLLRGGELLLTGGEVLTDATTHDQCRYVRDLAARKVTAVAIETGTRLPEVPELLVREANRLSFPVIELRQVVPFVGVAEAINGELVHESVSNLRYTADLTHVFSGIVADGGGCQDVIDELAARVGVPAIVYDGHGQVIASAQVEPTDASDVLSPQGPSAASVNARVTVRGVHMATLVLLPAPGSDVALLELAANHTAESLGLALLRTRAPSSHDLAASQLVRLAGSSRPHARLIRRLGAVVDFRADDAVIGVAARSTTTNLGLSKLDGMLRQYGRTAVDTPSSSEVHALLCLSDRRSAASTRRRLVADLRSWIDGSSELVVVVGPVVPRLERASLTLTAALETMQITQAELTHPKVIDSQHSAIERLLGGEEQDDLVDRLLDEHLAAFSTLPARSGEALLNTLETYFETGCNKSATAKRLHVTRQTLYARLDRAFGLLGGDPTGTPLALPLHLMLRLRHR